MNTIANLPAHHVCQIRNQNLRGFVSLECFWGLCCFASISRLKFNCWCFAFVGTQNTVYVNMFERTWFLHVRLSANPSNFHVVYSCLVTPKYAKKRTQWEKTGFAKLCLFYPECSLFSNSVLWGVVQLSSSFYRAFCGSAIFFCTGNSRTRNCAGNSRQAI